MRLLNLVNFIHHCENKRKCENSNSKDFNVINNVSTTLILSANQSDRNSSLIKKSKYLLNE